MACARLPVQKPCALISDSAAHLRHYLQLPRVPSVWKHQCQLAGLHHLMYGEYRCRLSMCVLPLPQPRSCCRLTLAFNSESRLEEDHGTVRHHNQKISKPWRIKLWTVWPGASFHSHQAFGAECWCALSPLEDWTCTGSIDRKQLKQIPSYFRKLWTMCPLLQQRSFPMQLPKTGSDAIFTWP